MNDLALKLKDEIIKRLTRNSQNADEPYLYTSGKTYTRRDLATEIENETEFGIKFLTDMLMLAIDITSRKSS